MGKHEVAVRLDREELHVLVTWGYSLRERSPEEFDNDPQMRSLLDKLKALRDERLVFGGDNE